jgi:hypothetical protein
MSNEKNLWWGYKHTSGTLQAKRYWDERDIEEALESPFVEQVVRPFGANDRDEALKHIEEQTR